MPGLLLFTFSEGRYFVFSKGNKDSGLSKVKDFAFSKANEFVFSKGKTDPGFSNGKSLLRLPPQISTQSRVMVDIPVQDAPLPFCAGLSGVLITVCSVITVQSHGVHSDQPQSMSAIQQRRRTR